MTKESTAVALVQAEPVRDFALADYLQTLNSPAALKQQQQLAAAYDAACTALIGPNDVQKEGGRTFKKKSAWRKLARHFTISTAVGSVEREYLNEHFLATVTVRATAPWGQSAEAVGACCTDEATGRRVITIADAIATAETRATNRAVSNLIAMGEVSAEEIGERKPYEPRGGNGNASAHQGQKSDADKAWPFGDKKGTPLGDFASDELEKMLKWCREKKKDDVAAAIQNVLTERALGGGEPEPFEIEDDENPFN